MEVRDGVDENGQLVGKYCGKIAPSPVVSSGNQLFIKFVSDYETHGAGFSIRYEIFKTGGWSDSLICLCLIRLIGFHKLHKNLYVTSYSCREADLGNTVPNLPKFVLLDTYLAGPILPTD